MIIQRLVGVDGLLIGARTELYLCPELKHRDVCYEEQRECAGDFLPFGFPSPISS